MRQKIIAREKSRERGHIRFAHFANLAGFWLMGTLSLKDVAQILKARKISQEQIWKIWRQNQGRKNKKGKLALQLILSGLMG